MEASLPIGRQIESAFAPTSPSSPTRSTRACLLPIISPHRAGRPKALAKSPPDWLLCGSSPVGTRLSPSLSGNRSPLSHHFHARPSGAKHCSGTSPGRLTCQPQLSQGNRLSHPLGWRQAAGGPENLPSQAPLGSISKVRREDYTSGPSSNKFPGLQFSHLENGLMTATSSFRGLLEGSTEERLSDPALENIHQFCNTPPTQGLKLCFLRGPKIKLKNRALCGR